MNNNLVSSLDNIATLCNNIDEVLSKDQVDAQEAKSCIKEIQQEVLALAYNVQILRNQIKIAGKNLTEAFEKVMQPVEENNING